MTTAELPAAASKATPKTVRRDLFDLQNRALLLMEDRALRAETALASANRRADALAKEVERLLEALYWLDRAAKAMITGIGVHNEREVGKPAKRIEGGVVSDLQGAVAKSSAALIGRQFTSEAGHGG